MREKILTYINENRLRSVLTKMDTITDKCFGKLLGNFAKDVVDDFMKDYNEEFLNLDEKERKYITKMPGSTGATLIRKHFSNIIDGEF